MVLFVLQWGTLRVGVSSGIFPGKLSSHLRVIWAHALSLWLSYGQFLRVWGLRGSVALGIFSCIQILWQRSIVYHLHWTLPILVFLWFSKLSFWSSRVEIFIGVILIERGTKLLMLWQNSGWRNLPRSLFLTVFLLFFRLLFRLISLVHFTPGVMLNSVSLGL